MTISKRLTRGLGTLLVLAAGSSLAASTDTLLREARALAEAREFEQAIVLLKQAQQQSPDDMEVVRAMARTELWRGDVDKAAMNLARLTPEAKLNPDSQLLLGNIAHRRGNYDEAIRHYQDVVDRFPEYADARDGLVRARRAREAPGELLWQLDAGIEYSRFDDPNRPDWNNEFLQLSRKRSDGQGSGYARTVRYEQFEQTEIELEAGLSQRLGNLGGGYVALAHTQDANFRPRNRIAVGAELRLGAGDSYWLLLDARHDWYRNTRVLNLTPGLRWRFADTLGADLRVIIVDQEGEDLATGWTMRFDARLSEHTSIYAGYAIAPETIAGSTIDTDSLFIGATLRLSPRYDLRFGYARDDRENTFVRHIAFASASYRF